MSDQLRRSSETVDAVMAAARELVERDGALDFNIRELLALAGVSNRAFYRHFPTKEALVAALASEVYHTMIVSLDAIIADGVARGVTRTDALANWVDGALAYVQDPARLARGRLFGAYEARLRDEHPELHRAVGRTLTQQVHGILTRDTGEGPGTTAPGDRGDGAPEIDEARMIVRLVISTLSHHVLDRTVPSPRERDALVAFVCKVCS